MYAHAMNFSQDVTPANVADDAVGVPGSDEKGPFSPSESKPQSSDTRRWYIARVMPRAEKTSRDNLLKDNIEAYAATQWQVSVWRNGRKKKIEKPVITQYIFVRVTEEERLRIVKLPYILSFLTNRAGTANEYGRLPLSTISDEEMRTLKEMLNGNLPVNFTDSGFSIGEKVSLVGWAEDIEGEIVRLHGSKTNCIGVRINQLGCAYIEVKPSMLKRI